MLILASDSVSQLYTIPTSDWTAINKRVGFVLAAQPAQTFITQYLADYPALLQSSLRWQQTTFSALIELSRELVAYAAQAIANFGQLNDRVKASVDGTGHVPDALKQQTTALLHELSVATAPMASSSNRITTQVLTFLQNTTLVDSQLKAHKDQFGDFWAPLGDEITRLENATGLVVGEWQAVTTDLLNTLALPIDVTLAFLESLNLDAALVCWQRIQAEATAFPALVTGQQHYWTNPTTA